nr:GspE/PulE family protein [Gammaproteobacteria bacterium]
AILFEAIREKVSDVHIEPYSKELVIRFRRDGVLKSSLTSQVKIAPFLVTRIKVLARLDIAEKRVPQDGRLTVKLGGKDVDLRVSTMPSVYGERVVLRLLDKEDTSLDLITLGMGQENLKKIDKLINKPHGIILVTGPTGSGKTTTLYACLRKLDRASLNIMTIEDPIEYYFDGISQTQVNSKANMSFARGLRAILRQDPDVVLVGEIRDTETAKISVQASLTGHLVLSTLHTNTAIGAITRLRDMEIEPFLLASTVQAVMSQRLVRRLCSDCKEEYSPPAYEQKLLKLKNKQKLFRAVGCDQCYNTGYSKRMAVYELILVDDKLREMINTNKSEGELAAYARKQSISIVDSSYELARQGETDLAEVIRVVQE